MTFSVARAWVMGVVLGVLVSFGSCGGAPCGPSNCKGCCNADNRCVHGFDQYECGIDGRACVACYVGVCLGVCSLPPGWDGGEGGGGGDPERDGGGTGGGGSDCGPQNCATCCLGEQCLPQGRVDPTIPVEACGLNGVTCDACTGNMRCDVMTGVCR